MALRTVPVILKYVELIKELAPDAWLLNFTNPAGILAETITRVAGFEHAVGICDNPSGWSAQPQPLRTYHLRNYSPNITAQPSGMDAFHLSEW
jgi:alpha-galactosidase/6-phospho-beta-glucosidase family protein